MDIDLMKIVLALISILGAIITRHAIPYFKAKTTEKTREDIYFWVKTAVFAMEMIYNEKGQGALKKDKVIAYIAKKGIVINSEDLDILIEAATTELHLAEEKLKE